MFLTEENLTKEKKEAKTIEASGKKRDYTTAIIILVVILAFLSAFIAFKTLRVNEYEVGGLRVLAKSDPVSEAKRILAPQLIIVQENLYSGNSTKNSAVAIQTAEIVKTLRVLGKNVSVYGVVEGIPLNETCTAETNYCKGARIVVTVKEVAQGGCNCIKIGLNANSESIEVEGNEAFYVKDNYAVVKRVSGFIGGVLQS